MQPLTTGAQLCLLVISIQAALWIGQTVRLTAEFPAQGIVWNFDIHNSLAGPPFAILGLRVGDPTRNVDFPDTYIHVAYHSSSTWISAAFNGFHVVDPNGTFPVFRSVSLSPATSPT